MRERAKELQKQKMEAQKRGGRGGMGGMGGGGSGYGGMGGGGGYGGQGGGPVMGDTLSTPAEPPKPTYSAPT